jgi:hypothetical protein
MDRPASGADRDWKLVVSVLHYAIESDNGIWTETVPVCGNDFRRTKKLTDDWTAVTCRKCRELCGFDEQIVEVERLGPGRIAA